MRFVSSSALDACKSASALLSLDLDDTKTLLPPGNVDIVFKAKKALGEVSKLVSPRDVLGFQMECRAFLKAVVSNIMEKSPIKADC